MQNHLKVKLKEVEEWQKEVKNQHPQGKRNVLFLIEGLIE
jgi:hypothetical protein